MRKDFIIRVVHSLPGRFRVRLGINPKSITEMLKTVKNHEGIHEISFNKYSKSVLIKFDTDDTTQEEIIIRLAVFISLENDLQPVRVYSNIKDQEMPDSAFFAGFFIVLGLASRLMPQFTAVRNIIDWISGVSTAYSIIEHGYEEVKERGNFDPEVLSVIYLVSSFAQGKFFTSTLFTWVATFGRHIIRDSSNNVEIQPRYLSTSPSSKPQYDVLIKPLNQFPGREMIFKFLPMLITNSAMGLNSNIEGTLLNEIKKVSQDHDSLLEGFGKFKNGIPIKLKYTIN
jgi:hypothetical protein